MSSIIRKWLNIPAGERSVEAVELWEVRWTGRNSEYSSGTKPEMEVFTSHEGAEIFAEALRNAFKLIRHTSGTGVKVKQRKP